MTTRIAINGLGRVGKLLVRALSDDPPEGASLALVNDMRGDPETHAHLLAFDTVHGRWPRRIEAGPDGLAIAGHSVACTAAGDIADLPLRAHGIDIAVDCTGAHKTVAALRPYADAGVAKVVVSAPVTEEPALNIVYGVNHDRYAADRHDLLTAASCTTNCLAPMVKVLHESIGIRHGTITTVHDATNTQVLVDRPAKDLRRARSALNSLVPTTTGSASAIGLIYPELAGRLDGHAVRVPLLNASLTDGVFELAEATTAEALNERFAAYAEGPLAGILGYEARPLVSADFLDDPRSAVVDGPATLVVDGTQAKVLAWYDNEWAYACRMADIVRMVARSL